MAIDAYETRLYDLSRTSTQRSAHAIVEVLYEMFHPQSVIDIGCGEGWFLDEFAKRGVKRLVGIEPNVEVIAAGEHIAHDLTQPFTLNEAFDLALCLEVAEHLEERYADTLVESLCELSDTVVFSAAIPKQGGNGHVNEQWPIYWARLFNRYDYGASDAVRRIVWNNNEVDAWYAQNTLVFTRESIGGMRGVLDVVHPALWEIYRGK